MTKHKIIFILSMQEIWSKAFEYFRFLYRAELGEICKQSPYLTEQSTCNGSGQVKQLNPAFQAKLI